jgi:arylsulfatase A-like enzyme
VSRARRLVLVVLGWGAACGGRPQPEWIDLARLEASDRTREPAPLPADVRAVDEDGQRWMVAALPRAAWRAEEGAGRFSAELVVLAVGHPADGAPPYRLRAEGRAFAFEADPARFGSTDSFTTDSTRGPRLNLALAPDGAPPESCELWACVAVTGREAGRVRGRRLAGAGFHVPSGGARALALRLPAEARLSFATSVEPLFGRRDERTAARTFRVLLDGALLFEHRAELGQLGEALSWHAVELPRGGVARARLEFQVDGLPAVTSFLAPVVGPREIGRYGARPYAARPDQVIFLADTFRADNLAAYGSTLELTPAIDAFAREARTFERAWSTSTHTLPAHSSMFSGVYPPQNGQVDDVNPLPEAVETLAERLAESGYRCGLVSDGVMVSSSHGLDQGFALFDERRASGTLERVRAFLAADDGRPIFLFVQTYAAHTPYAHSAATRERLGGRLELGTSFAELSRSPLLAPDNLLPLGGEVPPSDAEAVELARRLHDLYRAGVADLDGLFAAVRSELATRGVTPGGYLLFTSDHGESFFEHGRPFHANWVYEIELHVPLLLAGPGVAVGREARRVSLVDIAPTVAGLAGLAARAHWRGHSLLDPPAERVLFAFQSRRIHATSTLALVDGTRKLISYEDPATRGDGRLHAAFDLAQDPGERASVHAGADWPAELYRRHAAELETLLTPLVEAGEVRRTPEQLEELRELGYVGESGTAREDE